jgi:DNA-directed RNA polymerase specialized sigma24 family protein
VLPKRPTVATDLERVFLLWKDRSASRWASLLGDDGGDLLTEVWLRLERVQEAYQHTSEPATMRYIETVADFCLRGRRRTHARRSELLATALEMGVRGLTPGGVPCGDVEPPVDMETVIESSGLTRQQRIVIVGVRRGVDRETLAEMLEVTMETVREYERAGIARMREKAKEMGK